jgi:tRNA(fMet)-specific endonuclease VapC
VGISAITAVELRFGSSRRNNQKLTAAVDAFLSGISIHPFDDEAADGAGRLRAQLESEGRLIGLADTLIAAHAIALGAVLVTNDSDFERVSGLQCEDWTK